MNERRVRRESDVRGARALSDLERGVVIESAGGVYDVELDDGRVIAASLRGRLKLQQRTGDRIVVGDRVSVATSDDAITIESVEPRASQLARRAPGRNARKAKVIVANVEQVVVVFAAADPEPHFRMLDRFLVLAETNGLNARIILNKIDLCPDREQLDDALAPYRTAGYDVLLTSVPADIGIEDLRALVCGHDSVITGPSGVGKSSLLNALEPDLALRVGAVSEAVRKGRHTTVSARLIRLSCGGHLVDTPGLRELGLWGVEVATLDQDFPEFRPLLGQCRFANDCTHTHEPDCAIKEAVAAGTISAERYRSYADLRAEAVAAG